MNLTHVRGLRAGGEPASQWAALGYRVHQWFLPMQGITPGPHTGSQDEVLTYRQTHPLLTLGLAGRLLRVGGLV